MKAISRPWPALCVSKETTILPGLLGMVCLGGCDTNREPTGAPVSRAHWISVSTEGTSPEASTSFPIHVDRANQREPPIDEALLAPRPKAIPAAQAAKVHPAPVSLQQAPPTKSSIHAPMLKIEVQGKTMLGLPIGRFKDQTLLLGRDGAVTFLENRSIESQQLTQIPFRIEPRDNLVRALQDEFGRHYRVRSADPYLVVAPPERIKSWGETFQRMYQSITLYCSTHGVPIRPPEFPLIAVVFESRREFEKYAEREGAELPETCVGYYSQKTNRVALYEMDSPDHSEPTLDTIYHEATHQLAFNTGLHQRFGATPLWVAEGFAVQFEAPAFHAYRSRQQTSLWPPSQREGWAILRSNPSRSRWVAEQVLQNDELFRSDPHDAYTISWALCSYLMHRRSTQFLSYLHQLQRRELHQPYPRAERLKDFRLAFGQDLPILIRQAMDHVEQLD